MSTTNHWTTYDSPLGPLTLVGGSGCLRALRFPEDRGSLHEGDRDPALFAVAVRQLDEYFAGRREGFGMKLDLGGTPFQRSVWDALLRIPSGATTTYGALARELGRPAGVRAVAAAVGRTPVPIVVPCHRVLGSDGSLTGYRGGLPRKQALLDLERRAAASAGRGAPAATPASADPVAPAEIPASADPRAPAETPASADPRAPAETGAFAGTAPRSRLALPQLAPL